MTITVVVAIAVFVQLGNCAVHVWLFMLLWQMDRRLVDVIERADSLDESAQLFAKRLHDLEHPTCQCAAAVADRNLKAHREGKSRPLQESIDGFIDELKKVEAKQNGDKETGEDTDGN